MKFDPYQPDDLDPSLPLVQGLSRNEYKIVNHGYQRMISRYSRALEELDLTLLKLKQKLDATADHTVIQSVRSRIKSPASMCEKIIRLQKPCTLHSIQTSLYDIAGLRIICSYIDDIYAVLNWMKHCEDFEIMQIKDYIRQPKKSGYRSLHVIFSMTVFDHHTVEKVVCEVQLRTAAMDAWSALEHQLQYKKGWLIDENLARDLRECAADMYATDCRMQEIYRKLHS